MSTNNSTYLRLLNTSRWRRLRAQKLQASPFCEDCKAAGRYVAAEEVHHVIPVETAHTLPDMERLAYSPLNLASLCKGCHRERHRQLWSHSPAENARRAGERAAAFLEMIESGGERTPGGDF